MLHLPHYIHVACLELSRDFVNGVRVADRDDVLEDILMISWAMSDNKWTAKS